jgi:hypothetical protein
MLRFNDGVEIDTSGDYRPLKLKDGWYVVGHGLCMPVASRAKALAEIKTLSKDARMSAATEAAIRALRDAQEAAKKAVAEWAAQQNGRRDVVASAMLERLADCRKDKTGDTTLETVSELFEEYAELFEADGASAVAHALGQLGIAAQALGHRRSMRIEQ